MMKTTDSRTGRVVCLRERDDAPSAFQACCFEDEPCAFHASQPEEIKPSDSPIGKAAAARAAHAAKARTYSGPRMMNADPRVCHYSKCSDEAVVNAYRRGMHRMARFCSVAHAGRSNYSVSLIEQQMADLPEADR